MSADPPFSTDLLLLSPQDNCVIARRDLSAGLAVLIDAQRVVLARDVPLGHKLARGPLACGDKVMRWGAPIGSATQAIALGERIHTDNLASDYLPTYLADGEGSYVNSHVTPKAS